jgi:Uma2 family endonuclease
MNEIPLITAAQFEQVRSDLPDAGRWSELVRGEIAQLAPPETIHGTIVLNLSKSLADHLQQRGPDHAGDLCFELGILLSIEPDTVRSPPVCYFSGPTRFRQFDNAIASERPALVVELATSPVRRSSMNDRVADYLAAGVETVWIIDPAVQSAHIVRRKQNPQTLTSAEHLRDEQLFPGFELPVGNLFQEPDWWKK